MMRAAESDLDHYDALTLIRDRLLGLRCAIKGARVADSADRLGLLQISEDTLRDLSKLCDAFASERGVRTE
jgi:hypothetical protein